VCLTVKVPSTRYSSFENPALPKVLTCRIGDNPGVGDLGLVFKRSLLQLGPAS